MLSSLLTPTGILSDDGHPPTQPPGRESRSVKTAILLWLVLAHILVHPPELAVQRSLPSPSLLLPQGFPRPSEQLAKTRKLDRWAQPAGRIGVPVLPQPGSVLRDHEPTGSVPGACDCFRDDP